MCNALRYEVTRLPTQQAFLSFKTTMTAATKWNQDSAASPFIPVFLVSQIMFCPIVRRAKYNPERDYLPSITPCLLCASLCVWHNPVSPDQGDVGHCHGCNARVIRNNTSKHDTKQHHWRGGDSGSGLFDPHHWGPEAREFDETQ